MVGKHRVQIGDNTVRYDFVVSRNITIIRGDSGTGKTTLYNLIQEMNQKKNSGIVYSSTLSYLPRLITPDYVLCEDSNSGLEMFHALAEKVSAEVLEEHTKGTELEYHKKKLNKQYLYARAMKILSKFLLGSNINFDRCMV